MSYKDRRKANQNLKWRVGMFGLILLVIVCSSAGSQTPKGFGIGMISILSNPYKYDGKIILTYGFLNLRANDNGLWFHKEDLDAALWKDSFSVELTPEQQQRFKSLNQTYVVIQGTFHSKANQDEMLTSGTITNVTVLKPI